MVQSEVLDRSRPGTGKPAIGDAYSHATASSHRTRRGSPSFNPPAIQKADDTSNQHRIRRKLGVNACPRPRLASTNSVRPTWMATKLSANNSPRSPKASGIAADTSNARPINTISMVRMTRCSGLNQLLTQAVYCQPSQTANQSIAVCRTPRGVRCSSRWWDNWVTANT